MNELNHPTTDKLKDINDLNTIKSTDGLTLELLAEVPQVTKERIVTGNVRLSKQVKTQTINVPVTLTQEVLVIEHTATPHAFGQDELVKVIHDTQNPISTIMVDGKPVTLTDTPIEIVLSQQLAKVAIETQVTENVKVVTTSQTHEEAIPVTLRHEELVTEEVKLDKPTLVSSTIVENPDIKK